LQGWSGLEMRAADDDAVPGGRVLGRVRHKDDFRPAGRLIGWMAENGLTMKDAAKTARLGFAGRGCLAGGAVLPEACGK
jgi:hypothetical protein